jgi:hypothetical protein
MAVRIRTSKKIAPGVSVVTYQSPGQYFGGLAIFALIVLAAISHFLHGPLGFVLLGVVCLMWVVALVSGGCLAKIIWSFIFLFSAFTWWTSHGCFGNAQYCVQLQAKIEADQKKSAIEQAQRDMERCAEEFDWNNDPTCHIYSVSEINEAKARIAAREAAAAAEERARLDQEEKQRMDEAVKNRDLARSAAGQK